MTAWDNFTGTVHLFEEEGSWHCIDIPQELNLLLYEMPKGRFGYIAIRAKIASSEWDTSFLPAGDGSYFFTIPAKVRKKQHIVPGDTVTIEFTFRN